MCFLPALLCCCAAVSEKCACLGGPAYGRTCAPWDAADEAPWCHVSAPDACGEETYEAEGGDYWSHVPCPGNGAGAPYDAAKTAAAKVLLAALLPTSVAATNHRGLSQARRT